MKIGKKTNQQIGALWNRRLVLQLLREYKDLSRRQISEMTGLRGSTLTYIMRELEAQEVLRTAGKRECKSVGKKQVLMQINGELGWTLGVELRPERALCIIHDLTGRELDAFRVPIPTRLPAVVKKLKKALDERLDRNGPPAGRHMGIGIGVPGIVDCRRGVVLYSGLYSCSDFPLRQAVEDQTTIPTVVDHNANLALLTESRIGRARELDNFVYFHIQHEQDKTQTLLNAFGSALFINGVIYRGRHFAAGEMDGAIAPENVRLEDAQGITPLTEKDAPLTKALAGFADSLGASIAHIVNLLDPEAVILGADMPIRNEAFLARVRDVGTKKLIPLVQRQLDLRPAQTGEHAIATGGAIAAAEIALWGDADFF